MRGMLGPMCWLIVAIGLVPAFAQPMTEVEKTLEGTWMATKAERDGQAAEDVVGHRLSFTRNRFRIQSRDGRPLYAGTFGVNPVPNPATIDFQHTEGPMKGKAWKGIYTVDGDTLRVCDNAPNPDTGRPTAFGAKAGSGHIFITFTRGRP